MPIILWHALPVGVPDSQIILFRGIALYWFMMLFLFCFGIFNLLSGQGVLTEQNGRYPGWIYPFFRRDNDIKRQHNTRGQNK
ncbi:MAG: hypothetical protein COA85_11070 [Robiginitomaculum sp.]|nr:MAG: hypothetical protein COA85_11070 [Robiginitomaculum sp.]